jgi:molybdate transport system substrate-binding protein
MIHLVTSGAVQPACRNLLALFTARTGIEVDYLRWTSGGEQAQSIPARLDGGEAIDLVVLARPVVTQLMVSGRVALCRDIARSSIGLAVQTGSEVPDIDSEEALRATLLAAASLGVSTSLSGAYVRETLLPRLGIAEAMAGRTHIVTRGLVGAAVARGEVELGIQQLSELQVVGGITVVGPLPESLQRKTVFSAGLIAGGAQAPAAGALLRFLAGPEAGPVISAVGLEPVGAVTTPAAGAVHRAS